MVRCARKWSPSRLACGAALLVAPVPATSSATSIASDRVAPVALGLALILVAAKVGGDVAVRFGQVAVLGELLAGVVFGNVPGLGALGRLRTDPSIDIVAHIGALVLCDVGPRTHDAKHLRRGPGRLHRRDFGDAL